MKTFFICSIFLICCFFANVKSECFPGNYFKSCLCFETGVVREINCFNLSVKKAKLFFQKLSESNYSKSYELLVWSIVPEDPYEDIELIDHVFGDISFQKLDFVTVGPNQLWKISPNAFLNQRNKKNTFTDSLVLSTNFGVLPKYFFDKICTQFTNLEIFVLRGNDFLPNGITFDKDVFSACNNTPIRTMRLENMNEFNAFVLEHYFTEHLRHLQELSISGYVDNIERYAFSRSYHSKQRLLIYLEITCFRISWGAFVGMNSSNASIISLTQFFLQFAHPFTEFLDDSANNTLILLYSARIDCGCGIEWFFRRRHQIHSFPHNITVSKDSQLCDNGKEFFNLTSKDFEHCKSK